MNWTVGTILHFNAFQFEEPATATRPAERNKFFVVLRNMGQEVVVACLPTKVDRIPESVEQIHGCNDYPTGGWTAYMFEARKPITTNGWSFSIRTYMYGFGVRAYNGRVLSTNHPRVGVDRQVKGRLTADEFAALIACLGRSVDIKQNMRSALEGAVYDGPDRSDLVGEPSPSYGSSGESQG